MGCLFLFLLQCDNRVRPDQLYEHTMAGGSSSIVDAPALSPSREKRNATAPRFSRVVGAENPKAQATFNRDVEPTAATNFVLFLLSNRGSRTRANPKRGVLAWASRHLSILSYRYKLNARLRPEFSESVVAKLPHSTHVV